MSTEVQTVLVNDHYVDFIVEVGEFHEGCVEIRPVVLAVRHVETEAAHDE